MPNPDITYFATTNFRNQNQRFGIFQADRLYHSYMLGATGTGKSTLLKTMIQQDIEARRGFCLLDPHGDLVEGIFENIPAHRKEDVIYFNIPDGNLTLRYNPFKHVSYEKRSLVASGILEVLEKLWSTAWGVKLEHILRHSILTLLDQPSATLEDIPKLLLDWKFRKDAVAHVVNKNVKAFWQKEFKEYTKYDLLPVLNKVGGMLAHPVISRVLIENPHEISIRKAMDEGKIILVNLSKGRLGEDVAKILGALFVSTLGQAAMSRADQPEVERKPFIAYMDEFQNFTTLSLASMLPELRKFKVGLVLAHQYLAQLELPIKQAILANAGTIISFRLGLEDAKHMVQEMYPVFEVEDFLNLPNFNIYLRLMIDGKRSKGFSGKLKNIMFNSLALQINYGPIEKVPK